MGAYTGRSLNQREILFSTHVPEFPRTRTASETPITIRVGLCILIGVSLAVGRSSLVCVLVRVPPIGGAGEDNRQYKCSLHLSDLLERKHVLCVRVVLKAYRLSGLQEDNIIVQFE